jgi:protein-tyrosine phosphatase
MAEAIFQKMIDDEGLGDRVSVDSAGTGSWHVGERAHRGTRRVLKQHGINYAGRARQIQEDDIQESSYIIAMSQANVDEFRRRFGDF